ncbi:MAG TPA: ATP-binding protein [Chondromyces sp.]|nr:ATP-binding protein [Chondromyces sp.]
MNSIAKKFGITLFLALLVSIGYAYGLSYILYEKLYVGSVERELLEAGKRLALDYEGGVVDDEFIRNVEWFNEKTEFEVFAVRNPRELAACVPFEIDYDTLIEPEDRAQLIQNKPVEKIGYVDRFDRQVISIIVPLVEKERLNGILYLYLPLANINELTSDLNAYWLLGAFVFLLILLIAGTKWVNYMTKPLKEIEEAAKRLSGGDFSTRVTVQTKDEIGQLAKTFNKMAESIYEEDERKREFLATVSHELRTPLSYIKGYSGALESGMVKNEEEKHRFISIIVRETKRMERLVNDLLDLIKLEGDSFSIEKVPLPIAETVYQTVQRLIPAAGRKGISIHTEIDDGLIIEGDEHRIEQVIFNLVDNSLRYTEPGGQIHVYLFQEGKNAVLEVADTGIGIPEEDVDKVTQRFYRVNKARTRADGGTGLGLSIVENIVKLHSGEVLVSSMFGEGTTVKVTFPLIKE